MAFENDFLPAYEGQPEAAFLKVLEAWVDVLIAQDPERLRQVLYRVDVSESDAGKAALSEAPARELARLIAARQIAKWRYRQQNPLPPADEKGELSW